MAPNRNRRFRLFSRLGRVLAHPATWIVLGTLLAAWLVYTCCRPVVLSVPVVGADGALTLYGRGFGRRQGNSTLLLTTDENAIPLQQVMRWSDREIIAHLPPFEQTGATVQVRRGLLLARWPSAAVPLVVQAAGLPSEPYGYEVPVQADAPWPTFRHDQRNTGRSPLPARYQGDAPWAFQTGKGIFSTPIIDGQGTIYVGSADHVFYALHPDGSEKWQFQTGEMIDSAGALLPAGAPGEPGTVLFPSGDGFLYHLRADDGTPVWTFDATVAPRASYNNWWEGNVAVGYDGTLYAGNTNFNYYAIAPDGTLRWTYETRSNNWSIAGLAADGTIYWGSNDTFVRAVRPDGTEKWRTMTLGFIAASAAVGSDGTVYIGSFDSSMYALDPDTGQVKWKFKTGDHIYASATLSQDAQGRTRALYFGSADGILYAVAPDGHLLWTYDTGDPIRSSPVLGQAPEGETGEIVYFGTGNGRLYALHAGDGTRRWSFDTTSEEPEVRDRNDLNGSPALGKTGIYIGGEHGQVWYVPYDYCVHAEDARCSTERGEDLPADMAGLFYVTPGGSTELGEPPAISPATVLTLRLVVRKGGETIDAWMCNNPLGCPKDALQVSVQPPFPFEVQKSADGHYVHIRPQEILEPDTTYTVTVKGSYYTRGLDVGNLTVGGRKTGRFEDEIALHTAPFQAPQLPLTARADRVTALEWTRFAVPIPQMMPSLNQIGFDYMDWIVGTVEVSDPDEQDSGRFIWWAIGGRRDEQGRLVADPESDFILPLSGTYRGDTFIVTNRALQMPITGIPISFNLFEMRGQLGPDMRVRPGATLYADTEVLSIPTFGPYLVVAGLANDVYQKLLVTGTYVTRPYAQGAANARPPGLSVSRVTYVPPTPAEDGQVTAHLALEPGASYALAEHRPGILLLDAERSEAVYLDYRALLSATADGRGSVATVTLTVPAGTELPTSLEAVVLADVFPLYRERLAVSPQ